MKKFKDNLLRPLKSEDGSYLVLMAFMIILFLIFGVLAMDYSGKILQEHKRQNALDAAVLNAANYFPDINKVRKALFDYVAQVNDEEYRDNNFNVDTAGLMTFMLEAFPSGDTLVRWQDQSCSNIVYYEAPYFNIVYDSVSGVGTVALTLPSYYDPMVLPRRIFGDQGWLFYNKSIATARRIYKEGPLPPEFQYALFAGDQVSGTISMKGIPSNASSSYYNTPFAITLAHLSTLAKCDQSTVRVGAGKGTDGNYGIMAIGDATGADDYYNILEFNYSGDNTISIGSTLFSQPGLIVKKTGMGVYWRISGDESHLHGEVGWSSPEGSRWDNMGGVNDIADPDDSTGVPTMTWDESCGDVNVDYSANSPRLALLPVVDALHGAGANMNGTVLSFAWFWIEEFDDHGTHGVGDDEVKVRYLGPATVPPSYNLNININGNMHDNSDFGDFELSLFKTLNISGNLDITSEPDINIDGQNQYQDPNVGGDPTLADTQLLNDHTSGQFSYTASPVSFPDIPTLSDKNPCEPGIQDPNFRSPIIEWSGNQTINSNVTINGTLHITGNLTINPGAKIEGIATILVDGSITFAHNTGAGIGGTSLSDEESTNLFFYAGADGSAQDIIFQADTSAAQTININAFLYAPNGNIGNEAAFPNSGFADDEQPDTINITGGIFAGKGIYLRAKYNINVTYKTNEALPRTYDSSDYVVKLIK